MCMLNVISKATWDDGQKITVTSYCSVVSLLVIDLGRFQRL